MAYNDYDDDVSCFILESKLTNINEYEKWNIDVKIRLYMARLVEKLLRLSKPFVAPSTFFSLSDHTFCRTDFLMESGDNLVIRDRLENFQLWVTFTPIPGLHFVWELSLN